jgi:hypothetical protein
VATTGFLLSRSLQPCESAADQRRSPVRFLLSLLVLGCSGDPPVVQTADVVETAKPQTPELRYAEKVIAAKVAAIGGDIAPLERLVGDGWTTLGDTIRRDLRGLSSSLRRQRLELAQAKVVKVKTSDPARPPVFFEVIVELDGRRYGMMFQTELRGSDYQLLTVSSWITLEDKMF